MASTENPPGPTPGPGVQEGAPKPGPPPQAGMGAAGPPPPGHYPMHPPQSQSPSGLPPQGPQGPMQGGPPGSIQGGPQGPMQGGPQGPMQGGPQGPMQGGPQGPMQGGPMPGGPPMQVNLKKTIFRPAQSHPDVHIWLQINFYLFLIQMVSLFRCPIPWYQASE